MRLWALFAGVSNRADIEQYRQLLVPHFENDETGLPIDINQKVREDFYEALTEFGLCLKTALASRSFFEDASVTEQRDRDLQEGSEILRRPSPDRAAGCTGNDRL